MLGQEAIVSRTEQCSIQSLMQMNEHFEASTIQQQAVQCSRSECMTSLG